MITDWPFAISGGFGSWVLWLVNAEEQKKNAENKSKASTFAG